MRAGRSISAVDIYQVTKLICLCDYCLLGCDCVCLL